MSLLECRINREVSSSAPAHHVLNKPGDIQSTVLSLWTSAIRGKQADTKSEPATLRGFQNPWPSWHKPTKQQVWNALEWGDDQDSSIKLAAAHERVTNGENDSPAKLAAKLLEVQKPDFEVDTVERFKLTWLGHAGILLQLPALSSGNRPFRCLFDPMFSMRSSPSQTAGPLRTYPPPCTVEDLPEIDVVMISHDHYDHLDYDTIMKIWKCNETSVRFLVPLRNAAWFISCGIPEDRVVDLDWWDSVQLGSNTPIEVICTPSQHNSGRGSDPDNTTLWSSWYIKYPLAKPLRVYFGGDTGFQFHDAPNWPPTPKDPTKSSTAVQDEDGTWPTCPAFEEIAKRLGPPDLLMLPIWVGATFDYLRSFSPLPNSINPFPRHKPGLTGANHMPPWDAVRVLRLMTADSAKDDLPIAVAIHWGTFVTDPVDIPKILGQLEYACQQHGVQFARSLEHGPSQQPTFLALDHGQSVSR